MAPEYLRDVFSSMLFLNVFGVCGVVRNTLLVVFLSAEQLRGSSKYKSGNDSCGVNAASVLFAEGVNLS
jgi:hypothetical protein